MTWTSIPELARVGKGVRGVNQGRRWSWSPVVPVGVLGALGEHWGHFKLLKGWIDHMGDVW